MDQPCTVYAERATAERVAERNGRDDTEWTYEVESFGERGYVVVVFDQDGFRLGPL